MCGTIGVERRTLKIDFITTVKVGHHLIPAFENLTFANSELFWIAPVFGVGISDNPAISSESSDPMNGSPVTYGTFWASTMGNIRGANSGEIIVLIECGVRKILIV